MINNNDISGSFHPLTVAQIKGNIKFVTLWLLPFLIIIMGIVCAVKTGIVWIAAASGVIWVCTLIFVASIRNVKYVCSFGMKYNLLRLLICGFLVYSGVAWRGLLGVYNRFGMKEGWDLSISTFGWMVMTLSFVITMISKLSLYRIVNVHVADLVGVIEMTGLAIFIGSIMFMLLYT